MSAAVGNVAARVGVADAHARGAWLLALPVITFILLFLLFPVATVL